MTSSSRADRPARTKLRRWAPRAALLVGSLLVAEGLLRLFLVARGLPQSPAGLGERIETVLGRFGDNVAAKLSEDGADANPERRFSHPFQAWETEEGLAWLEQRLARGPSTADGRYEIWLVGGSVAYNFGKSKGGPRFIELLRADPRFAGRTIELENCAHPEYKEPQQVLLVVYLLSLGLAPDAIIDLNGFNEAAIGDSNVKLGSHPAFPSIAAWSALQAPREADPELARIKDGLVSARDRARRVGECALTRGCLHSALLGWAAVLYVERCNTRWSQLVSEYETWVRSRRDDLRFRGPRLPDTKPDAILDAIVTNFEQSSRTLSAICDKRWITYLHVLQPTMNDGSKPLSAEEQALPALKPAWVEGVRTGYPRLRATGVELKKSGIAFEDASDVFKDVPTTLYFDAIHFGDEGNELLAERIARAFLASLPIDIGLDER